MVNAKTQGHTFIEWLISHLLGRAWTNPGWPRTLWTSEGGDVSW